MYKVEIPTGQKRELIRLEQADLTDRYGERVSSKGSLPSALFIAEEDEEIVGYCLPYILTIVIVILYTV